MSLIRYPKIINFNYVFVNLTYVIRIDWFFASENVKNSILTSINSNISYYILYDVKKVLQNMATYDSSCFGKHHQQWQKCEEIPRSFVC